MSNSEYVIGAADALGEDRSHSLSLTANENRMSKTAEKYMASNYANQYYFESNRDDYSDFPEFVAVGSLSFDNLLNNAKKLMNKMFDSDYANLCPLSGIHAMLMVLLTLTEKDDGVASLDPQLHGHFATKNVVTRIGRRSFILPILSNGLDIDGLKKFVIKNNIKLIYLDVMSSQHAFDISEVRKAVGNDILIVYDASHILGLIAGKAVTNPLNDGADVLCGNTHKTLPGPHRGIILAKEAKCGQLIDERGSNLYSSVHANSLLALIVTIHEMNEFGDKYAHKVIENAQLLQKELIIKGVLGANCEITENHQVHILRKNREDAMGLLASMKDSGMLAHVCYSGDVGFFVRIGTQEITRRGMGATEMQKIAELLAGAMNGLNVIDEVVALNDNFTSIKYSFDT